MPVAPKVNPAAKDFLVALINDGNITDDPNLATADFLALKNYDRRSCFLLVDEAVKEEFAASLILSCVTIKDGKLQVFQNALVENAVWFKDEHYDKDLKEAFELNEELIQAGKAKLDELRTVKGKVVEVIEQPDRPSIRMHDSVTWSSFNDVMHGKVEIIRTAGGVQLSSTQPIILASPQNPIATIRIYEKVGSGFEPTDRKIVRPVKMLTRIDALQLNKSASYISAKKAGKSGEIILYGDIGDSFWGGISAAQFRSQLSELKNVDELNIRINSGGGDVFEGVAIYNAIREHKAHKIVHIDGLAASIATIIASAGDVIEMAETAQYMIHRGWTITMGNRHDLQKMLDRLDATDEILASVYMGKTGQDHDDIIKWMDEETWFTASEAKEYGFVDEVVNETAIAASIANRQWFKKRPGEDSLEAVEKSQLAFLARGRRHAASR